MANVGCPFLSWTTCRSKRTQEYKENIQIDRGKAIINITNSSWTSCRHNSPPRNERPIFWMPHFVPCCVYWDDSALFSFPFLLSWSTLFPSYGASTSTSTSTRLAVFWQPIFPYVDTIFLLSPYRRTRNFSWLSLRCFLLSTSRILPLVSSSYTEPNCRENMRWRGSPQGQPFAFALLSVLWRVQLYKKIRQKKKITKKIRQKK